MSQRVLLLSLRPRFADAIVSGQKTIELRRRPVNALPGTRALLYSSAPVMAIVGTARLRTVEVADQSMAWRKYRRLLGLTRDEYDAYLEGAEQAYLLHLGQVQRLNEPLHLHRLRREGAFQPPQSFRYVAASDPGALHELAAAI